jgi:hypothetical protein
VGEFVGLKGSRAGFGAMKFVVSCAAVPAKMLMVHWRAAGAWRVRGRISLFASGEEEEEEGLYLRIETRKRVQTNDAKSKRRRASPTKRRWREERGRGRRRREGGGKRKLHGVTADR